MGNPSKKKIKHKKALKKKSLSEQFKNMDKKLEKDFDEVNKGFS